MKQCRKMLGDNSKRISMDDDADLVKNTHPLNRDVSQMNDLFPPDNIQGSLAAEKRKVTT